LKSSDPPKQIFSLFNDTVVVQNEIYKEKNSEIYSTPKRTSKFNINNFFFIKNTTSTSPSKSPKSDQVNEVNLALFTAKKNLPVLDSSDNTANNNDSSKCFI